jgi:hypothetical protein
VASRLRPGERLSQRMRVGSIGERLRAESERAIRWDVVLVWFMRALALVWMVKGLGAWALILGAGHAAEPFEGRSPGFQASTIYFAVIDLLAAVGLWLTSTWGGVIWLLAVMSNLILAFFIPAFVASGALSVGVFIGFTMLYLVLSWLAAREG